MKNTFHNYYNATAEEFPELLKTCTFVFDTNTLLDLYRFTEETRESLLATLNYLQNNLWMPHQVGLEYHRNRPSVIDEQIDAYTKTRRALDAISDKLGNDLNSLRRRHPYIDIDAITTQVKNALAETVEALKNELDKQKTAHPFKITDDPIRSSLNKLFDGKVGQPYLADELAKIYEQGAVRYDSKQPPGYKDAQNKDGVEKFGDLIIWFQMIAQAKVTKRPIVFVTSEDKPDWWWDIRNKKIGPLPQLGEEMFAEAGVRFYLYKVDQFLSYMQPYTKVENLEVALQEIKELQHEDELVKSAVTSETAQERLRVDIMSPRLLTILQQNLRAEGADLSTRILDNQQRRERFQSRLRADDDDISPRIRAAIEREMRTIDNRLQRDQERWEIIQSHLRSLDNDLSPRLRSVLEQDRRAIDDLNARLQRDQERWERNQPRLPLYENDLSPRLLAALEQELGASNDLNNRTQREQERWENMQSSWMPSRYTEEIEAFPTPSQEELQIPRIEQSNLPALDESTQNMPTPVRSSKKKKSDKNSSTDK